MSTPYQCPRCTAPNDGEDGIFCECAEDKARWCEREDGMYLDDHGETEANPCFARCNRCGWAGDLPSAPVKFPQWMQTAIAAGWRMSEGN